jgi:hypothetical protein
MADGRIDFISNYCDRWCERCAFTTRCSAFALEAALSMCGDAEEAFELAVGQPPLEDDSPRPEPPQSLIDDVNAAATMSPAEEAEWKCREHERDLRIEATPIMRIAWPYTRLAHDWLRARHDVGQASADAVVVEALAIVAHDASFISIKLLRALDGLDRHRSGEEVDDDPIQNDWNGTAKVVLASIERSEAAWRSLTTGDDTPALLADQLVGLRALVEAEFPNAERFVRPGFDDRR